jgi:hypothetical protein
MTYAELYEKVKPELEKANNMPFKEYKKVRKTFSELFEECSKEECEKEEEESGKLKESYNNLYEKYVSEPELEPLTEQEAIYLIGKINEGERLSESELQRLKEYGGFTLGQNIRGGLANMFNPNGAYAQAYNDQKKLNKSNKQNLRKNLYQNQFAQGSNEWLQNKAKKMGYETDVNGNIVNKEVQQKVVDPNKLKQNKMTNVPPDEAQNAINRGTQANKSNNLEAINNSIEELTKLINLPDFAQKDEVQKLLNNLNKKKSNLG